MKTKICNSCYKNFEADNDRVDHCSDCHKKRYERKENRPCVMCNKKIKGHKRCKLCDILLHTKKHALECKTCKGKCHTLQAYDSRYCLGCYLKI